MAKKTTGSVLGVRFECGKCRRRFTVTPDNCQWHGREQGCETCGSHVSVGVKIACLKCLNLIEVKLFEL